MIPSGFEGNSEEKYEHFTHQQRNGEERTTSKKVPRGDMQMDTKCNYGEEMTL